jgi:hypothetical protein
MQQQTRELQEQLVVGAAEFLQRFAGQSEDELDADFSAPPQDLLA